MDFASPTTDPDEAIAATEDAAFTPVNLLTGSADPDGDTLSVTNVTISGAYSGVVSVSGSTLTVNTADPSLEGLGVGENSIVTVGYTVDDGNGGTDTSTATVEITGVNDAPVLTSTVGTASNGLFATAAISNFSLTLDAIVGNNGGIVVEQYMMVGGTWHRIDQEGVNGTFTVAGVQYSTSGNTAGASIGDGTRSGIWLGDSFIDETVTFTVISGAGLIQDLKSEFWALNNDGRLEHLFFDLNGARLQLNAANLAGTAGTLSVNAADDYIVANPGEVQYIWDSYNWDIPFTAGSGATLASVFSGATDADAGSGLDGYAITSGAASGGNKWQYSTNGGTTWVDFPTVSEAAALLLDPSTLVRWTGQQGSNTAFSVVAVDDTEAALIGSTINVSTRGGETPYSTNVATLAANAAPVLFDLNGDNQIAYTQIAADVNLDGQMESTRWVGPEDAMLFWDKHGDGSLTDMHQFAFAQFGGNTDLEGLALRFDSNQDGLFNAQDAEFGDFRFWQDMNQNGRTDEGEVRALIEAGIESLVLQSDGVVRQPVDGVTEYGHTGAALVGGGSMLVVDAALQYRPLSDWVWAPM